MLQTIYDLATFLGWVWQNITDIMGNAFLPIKYVYTFLRQFFITAFSAPVAQDEMWTFDDSILGLFSSIPYFSVLISCLMIALTLVMAVLVLKSFLRS